MVSVTAIARPEREEASPQSSPSRIGRLIVILNLAGLAVLIGGALLLNELRQGLVEARIQSLRTEGQLIANVIDRAATVVNQGVSAVATPIGATTCIAPVYLHAIPQPASNPVRNTNR